VAAKTIPTLPSRDFDRTAAFYARLGFAETARFPAEYLIVQRVDGIELHFWPSPTLDPAHNDAGCYVRYASAEEAAAIHAEWSAASIDAHHLRPLGMTDYGLVEFALLDPDRNLVRVGGVVATTG